MPVPLSFVLSSLALILIPGPAMYYVMGRAQRSSREALYAVLGLVIGDVVLIALAAAGFATVLLNWPRVLLTLKCLGLGYLAWVAIRLLGHSPPSDTITQRPGAGAWRRITGEAFLLTLGNLKPLLFFAAFFTSFLPNGAGTGGFAKLGAIFECLNIVVYVVLISVVAVLKPRIGRHIKANWVARAGALALLACVIVAGGRLIIDAYQHSTNLG